MIDELQNNGERVNAFSLRWRNLSRTAGLRELLTEMFESGAWRDYIDGVGQHTWRSSEFDYFLIAHDVEFGEIAKVLTQRDDRRLKIAAAMDPGANSHRRRSLDRASAEWQSGSPTTLEQKAATLGWISPKGRLATPVPPHALHEVRTGKTWDEAARESREKRIPETRKKDIAQAAADIQAELTPDELRYFLTILKPRGRGTGAGKPSTAPDEIARQRADVDELGGDTAKLAERWGVARSTARDRVRRLRVSA